MQQEPVCTPCETCLRCREMAGTNGREAYDRAQEKYKMESLSWILVVGHLRLECLARYQALSDGSRAEDPNL